MKKIIILSLFSAFLFSYQLSSAESYPTSCPMEAQSILKAVGGCSALDCKIYSNICAKCCVKVVAPVKTTAPAPLPKPTTKPVPATAPKPASETKAVVPSVSSSPASMPSIQENLPASQTGLAATATPEETAVTTQKTEPIVSLIEFVKNIFTGFFRFFGFGK